MIFLDPMRPCHLPSPRAAKRSGGEGSGVGGHLARLRHPPPRPLRAPTLPTASKSRGGETRGTICTDVSTIADRGDKRFFADGGFFTPDRRARFVAVERPSLSEATTESFPLRLNTGRVRDQWHTMTRTGLSAKLAAHLPEPFVEVHPHDAAAAGLDAGGFARVSTVHGSCVVKVVVSESQRPGSLFVPIHWSDQTASSARVGDLVSPRTDPFSGQPEAKATPAAIAPVDFPVRGYVRSRGDLALPSGTWWARVTTGGGTEYRLASTQGPLLWHDFAHRALSRRGSARRDARRRTLRRRGIRRRHARGLPLCRTGGCRALGCVGIFGSRHRRRRVRGANFDGRHRGQRSDDLCMLRRRRGDGSGRGGRRHGPHRRRDRRAAARRHQLRIVSARTQTDGRPCTPFAYPLRRRLRGWRRWRGCRCFSRSTASVRSSLATVRRRPGRPNCCRLPARRWRSMAAAAGDDLAVSRSRRRAARSCCTRDRWEASDFADAAVAVGEFDDEARRNGLRRRRGRTACRST